EELGGLLVVVVRNLRGILGLPFQPNRGQLVSARVVVDQGGDVRIDLGRELPGVKVRHILQSLLPKLGWVLGRFTVVYAAQAGEPDIVDRIGLNGVLVRPPQPAVGTDALLGRIALLVNSARFVLAGVVGGHN